jgi:pimeloyl-ACP methyl ester carboxylesterase
MNGSPGEVTSTDGTTISFLTAGTGSPLLLVHGGMTTAERWSPMWTGLGDHFETTAMHRRGRATSGDATAYRLESEYADVAAVADHLYARTGAPVDVLAHSYGAVCALGAAAHGAPIRSLVLYEPPGPQAVPASWRADVNRLITAGEPGRAMAGFLIDIVGMSREEVMASRDTPVAHEAAEIVAATMRREADALADLDLVVLAERVTQPALMLLGSNSPRWAHDITATLARHLPHPHVTLLDGVGHEGIDTCPEQLISETAAFLTHRTRCMATTVGRERGGKGGSMP